MSDENTYYVMSAKFVKSTFPQLYYMTKDLSGDGLFNADTPLIAAAMQNLLEKINNLSEEEELQLTFQECTLIYHVMVKVIIAMHAMIPALRKKEGKEKLVDSESTLKANADLQEFMDRIIDDMSETFPDFIPEVTRFREDLHTLDLQNRRMELDKETPVITISLDLEQDRKFFLLLFNMFDLVILKNQYELSRPVREADFFFVSDFHEVFEKIKKVINENETEIDLTLRDAVVVFTISNISQKLYLTNAGDDIMELFKNVGKELKNGMSATDMRSFYLKMAASISEVIEENAIDEETFINYIEPIKEFGF